MRTIKFRAKELDTCNWVYGELHLHSTKPHIHDEFKTKYIDTSTVGQFTGIHDRNGKEIYEGDFIRSFDSQGEPIIHAIEYENNDAQFIVVLAGYTKYDFGCGGITQKWINEFEKEVIGNIHDNTELLKQE